MNINSIKLLALAAILLIGEAGCQKDPEVVTAKNAETYKNDAPTAWFDLERRLVKETAGFTPPVVARAFGYTGVALYETVAQGTDDYKSLAGQINGLTSVPQIDPTQRYHWQVAANSTLADIIRSLFPTATAANKARIDSLEQVFYTQSVADTDIETIQRSVAFGRDVAKAIYSYSRTDGQDLAFSNNFPAYTIPTGPGLWVPTAAGQKPLQPYWGSVRPFRSENVDLPNLLPAPIEYSETPGSPFYVQGQAFFTACTSATAEHQTIAKFWSDDPVTTSTPPGHSMSILTLVLRRQNASLPKAAEGYAKLGIALHDAFISCWKAKYIYNVLRPVTYCKAMFDPNFTPLLSTPPFPEYPSGHSVQSGAMSTVLTSLFGENYSFTDNTHQNRTDIDGTPRFFPSFRAAADEAAISRLYGGIHYQEAIDKGVTQGEKIGNNVITKIQFR
jgi:hypothetical protein